MKTYKVTWITNTPRRKKETAHYRNEKAAKEFADWLIREGKTDEQPKIEESSI